jgi:hypothetical protein
MDGDSVNDITYKKKGREEKKEKSKLNINKIK